MVICGDARHESPKFHSCPDREYRWTAHNLKMTMMWSIWQSDTRTKIWWQLKGKMKGDWSIMATATVNWGMMWLVTFIKLNHIREISLLACTIQLYIIVIFIFYLRAHINIFMFAHAMSCPDNSTEWPVISERRNGSSFKAPCKNPRHIQTDVIFE